LLSTPEASVLCGLQISRSRQIGGRVKLTGDSDQDRPDRQQEPGTANKDPISPEV